QSVRTYEEREITEVVVEILSPGGRRLSYVLGPGDGMGRSAFIGAVPVRRQVEGQPLEVWHLNAGPGFTAATTTYLGLWPGADVLLPLAVYSDAMDGTVVHPTEEEVATVLRSLRPATAEQ